jgi:N-methylhydantoinase A/oxoprolinase/acetone carboxylase beta subunit
MAVNIGIDVGGTFTDFILIREGAAPLLTTEGVRDALEMRRGVRETQYDNTFTNVKPLVPR